MALRTGTKGEIWSEINSQNFRIRSTSGTNFTISGAGAAVTLTFATVSDGSLTPGWVEACYDAAPTGGLLKVSTAAGVTVWAAPLSATTVQQFDLNSLLMDVSTGMLVSLASPGGAIKGYLNVRPHAEA